jgi:hypothetical protein
VVQQFGQGQAPFMVITMQYGTIPAQARLIYRVMQIYSTNQGEFSIMQELLLNRMGLLTEVMIPPLRSLSIIQEPLTLTKVN